MKIVTKSLAELIPADYNPREITDEAMAGLTASIDRFGNVVPIVWNERTGNVVGGHQRLKVLQERGEKKTQVVVVDLAETEEKALNITLNNPGIAGEFTPEVADLLAEIQDAFPEMFEELRLDFVMPELDDEPDVPSGLDNPEAAYERQFAVAVLCKSEADQEKVYGKLLELGYKEDKLKVLSI